VYHATSLIVHRQFERHRPPSSARAVRVVKMVTIFLWFTLSLPLLQLDLGSSIDFYARLVPG
jgi:hypothetical protein